ncbi:acetoacetate decarboxylase family protein [Rhizobiaceae sp. 2RAB30]
MFLSVISSLPNLRKASASFNRSRPPPSRAVAVDFLTDADRLSPLLPPGFSLAGEPVVTVEVQYLTELEWLAGRGYNTLGVKFGATFKGQRDEVTGLFLSVLWENLPDPILTGRDELGFAKLHADIPAPRIFGASEFHGASWLGHRFVDIELHDIAEAEPLARSGPAAGGTLHYKFVPSTGNWGEEDAAYACLTPPGGSRQHLMRSMRVTGSVKFHQASWEQMPTQFHIVNALANLPIVEWRGATITETRGGKDLSDQRRLV